jgi:Uma2 family endonuclease
MKTTTRTGPHTFDDFALLVGENEKADLIDGVIYMASPENTDANELFVWLLSLFHDFVEFHDLGRIYGSRVAFRLDEKNAPEPDIAFVARRNLHRVQRGRVEGPPDLAVEIVSPDSVERDYETKKRKYAEAGVPEYWIIDEMAEQVTLLSLAAGSKYREVKPKKGILRSKLLPGFWLRPEWLWQAPRPRKAEILAQLLEPPRMTR